VGSAPRVIDTPAPKPSVPPPAAIAPPKGALKLQLGLHIRHRGDTTFPGTDWAGAVADRLWIEALSINVQSTLTTRDIEYKGLSANGFETPWISDGASCGTKGMSVPLIGFAVRLKGSAALHYDCEYSGYFASGITVGPLRNGVPCRSKTAADPLIAVQLSIVKRGAKGVATAEPAVAVAKGKRLPKRMPQRAKKLALMKPSVAHRRKATLKRR